MPPERIIFLQRLLEPSFCILAPYLHTFLDRAVWHHQLLLCQNLCKSIQKKARADLAPPQICHFSATKLSLQILHFFQIGFLTILASVFARHISGTILGCYASLQNIFSQFWCLQCDIFKIFAAQANEQTACAQPHNSKIQKFCTDDASNERRFASSQMKEFPSTMLLASGEAEIYGKQLRKIHFMVITLPISSRYYAVTVVIHLPPPFLWHMPPHIFVHMPHGHMPPPKCYFYFLFV